MADERVSPLFFTGVFSTGGFISQAAGTKKQLMELSGARHSSYWQTTASAVVEVDCGVVGQNSCSVQRVFFQVPLASSFIAKMVEQTVKLKVGSRHNVQTDVGRVAIPEQFDEIGIAVTRANDSPFVLQAGIYARTVDVALGIAKRLRFGAVNINDCSDFVFYSYPLAVAVVPTSVEKGYAMHWRL